MEERQIHHPLSALCNELFTEGGGGRKGERCLLEILAISLNIHKIRQYAKHAACQHYNKELVFEIPPNQTHSNRVDKP